MEGCKVTIHHRTPVQSFFSRDIYIEPFCQIDPDYSAWCRHNNNDAVVVVVVAAAASFAADSISSIQPFA
jgi:hypothetical protein